MTGQGTCITYDLTGYINQREAGVMNDAYFRRFANIIVFLFIGNIAESKPPSADIPDAAEFRVCQCGNRTMSDRKPGMFSLLNLVLHNHYLPNLDQ